MVTFECWLCGKMTIVRRMLVVVGVKLASVCSSSLAVAVGFGEAGLTSRSIKLPGREGFETAGSGVREVASRVAP